LQSLQKSLTGPPVPWIIHKDPTLLILVELSVDAFAVRLASHVKEVEAHIMLRHINSHDNKVNACGGMYLPTNIPSQKLQRSKALILILWSG
jgi:hypothetical protein